MAESRAKRMQVVLLLADRNEQRAGQEFAKYKAQLEAEVLQLQQLDDYAHHYLTNYSTRRTSVSAQELIGYSSFIQRLGEARKDQQARIDRMQPGLRKLQQAWQLAHHKTESIKQLIQRLQQDENLLLDKRLQKELDELVGQTYSRSHEAPQ